MAYFEGFDRRKLRAFTVLEMVVVVAIVLTLAAIGFASLGNLRNASARAQCLSNLKQLGAAAIMFNTDNGMKNPSVNFWPRELSLYLLPNQPAIDALPTNRRKTPFYCPAAKPSDVINSAVHSPNVTYGQNGTRYAGLNQLALDYAGNTVSLSRLITYLDGTLYNVFDGTPERVPTNRHQGPVNACFADGHAETLRIPVGSPDWNNLFWGYPRY